MAKKMFLIPLAAAIAALVSPAQAAIETSQTPNPLRDNLKSENTDKIGTKVFYRQGEDMFSFVLGKSEGGQVYAYHSSHSSHGSHGSHGSHSSHYSSR